jgi:hypothetical protein
MVDTILKEMLAQLPKRSQDVLSRRFGLKNNHPETLETIGDDFGITRERVRQIESSALRLILQKHPEELADFTQLVRSHLERFGGAREERKLLEEIRFMANDRHPASQSRIRFLLAVGTGLKHVPSATSHYSFWATSDTAVKQVHKFLDASIREMKKLRQPVELANVETFAKRVAESIGLRNVSGGVALSFLSISRDLLSNPYGHYGHAHWPTIVPRGVKDRAYLVLKHHQSPLHFRDLAKKINEQAKTADAFHPTWQKQVEVQTVHNELIKDGNFVLVGRGMYALKEWGYEPGTVRDLIGVVLAKARRPLTKQEIIEAVKAKRLVQENTIIINLQNRKFFERLAGGRYRVRTSRRTAAQEA